MTGKWDNIARLEEDICDNLQDARDEVVEASGLRQRGDEYMAQKNYHRALCMVDDVREKLEAARDEIETHTGRQVPALDLMKLWEPYRQERDRQKSNRVESV